jgi:hypothetical protein
MDKIYRWQNISEAKRIGGKTYQQQNVSAAKCISSKPFGGKMYVIKTYQLQSRWGAENGFYKATGELQTGFLKPLGSCKRVF